MSDPKKALLMEHLSLESDLSLEEFSDRLRAVFRLPDFSYDAENESEWVSTVVDHVEYNIARPFREGTLTKWDSTVPEGCNFGISLILHHGHPQATHEWAFEHLVVPVGRAVAQEFDTAVCYHRTWEGVGRNIARAVIFRPHEAEPVATANGRKRPWLIANVRQKMKVLLFLFAIGVASLPARDIVLGIVTFDEPSGFHGFGPHHDPGDSPFELSRTVIQYQPDDNSARSFRQFDIGIGVVGYEIGQGKRITFRALSEEELKAELLRRGGDGRVDVSLVEVIVSNRKAFRISSHRPAPSLRPGAVLYSESYFIPFEPNRGVTLQLTADSEGGISGLRALLTRVSIPKDPKEVRPPPPPEPTADEKKKDEIVRNLRLITGAADQFLLEHGATRVTMAELKNQKDRYVPDLLVKLTSVDGEVYDDLVFEQGRGLRVKTQTLGEIVYAP